MLLIASQALGQPAKLLLCRIMSSPEAMLRSLLWVQCVQKCCEKFMKHSARVGMRFAELSSQAEQQMQQLLQQQSGK